MKRYRLCKSERSWDDSSALVVIPNDKGEWVPYEEAATRIAELEAQGDELAIGLQRALDDLKYIKGIVERGTGETILDDQPIATAIREYVKTLEAELSEYQQTASLMYTADHKAIEKWREGNPERALIIPDRRDMVAWLLEQFAAAQERERRLRNLLIDVADELSHPENPNTAKYIRSKTNEITGI